MDRRATSSSRRRPAAVWRQPAFREVMSGPVRTLQAALTLAAAVAQVQREGGGAYAVVDERGRLQGPARRTIYSPRLVA